MDNIKIIGYKSIKDIEIKLQSINILIGANGAGKSNFISFFEFLHHLYEQKLQTYIALNGGIDKFIHQAATPSDKIEAKLTFNHSTNDYGFTIQKSDDTFIFVNEDIEYRNDKKDISNHKKEAQLKNAIVAQAQYIKQELNGLKKYHFHDTGKQSPFNAMSHIQNDIYFLYEKGENLAAYLYHIKENYPESYQIILKTIQSIAPYFLDFYLQPNETGYIRLQWTTKHSTMMYGVNDLSDGTIRFIALVVLFMQPKLPNTIRVHNKLGEI
jgi:predicted ATPase